MMNQSSSGGLFPLTLAQQGVWLDQVRQPDRPLYNMGFSLRIDGPVDGDRLARAIQLLVRQNDALRILLREVGGEFPRQEFAPGDMPARLGRLDFSDRSDPDREALDWMRRELDRPFQMFGGPLFFFCLIRTSAARSFLFLKYHHVIMDAYANSLLIRRLAKIYAGLGGGEPLEDEPAYSYLDYVGEDLKYAESERLNLDARYWRDKFAETPEPLFERVRAAGEAEQRRDALVLPRPLYDRMMAFAASRGASTFHLLLAALYVYFARTRGRDDFVIGLPTLNRGTAQFKKTLGLFTGINPTWLRLGRGLTVAELLREVGRELRKDYRHQRLPLHHINRLARVHARGRMQIFDVVLNYQRQSYDVEFDGRPVEGVSLRHGAEQTPLAVEISEYNDQLDVRVNIDHSLAALDEAEMELFKQRFRFILEQMLEHPETPVGRLDIMPEEERRRVLSLSNAARRIYAPDKTLTELFEERVAEADAEAEATALIFEGRRTSYSELNRRANQLARRLAALGVGPSVRVGICLERGPDLIVAMLGVLKAGGCYVPLDPSSPAERLQFIVADARPRLVLTEERLKPLLLESDATSCLLMGLDGEPFARESEDNLAPRARPDSPAYVIYTSGTTGRPKGTLVSHHNVVRLFRATGEFFGFGAGDVWTMFHSFAFDFSVWEIWGALLHGGSLLIAPRLTTRSPEDFYDLLCEHKVTILNQTPSAFGQLVKAEESRGRSLPLSLRWVIFGGEALDHRTLKPWFARHGDRRPTLVNMYGITETTVHVTCRPLSAADQESPASLIGPPIGDLSLFLLDEHMSPVPLGVPGEIYVGGAGLALGYLGRAALNAERFVPDPFDPRPGARLYRSGDLARFLPTGDLEYLGRGDDQVKVRGFRVELGEIKSVLSEHPEVSECEVVARPNDGGAETPGLQIVAYVVPRREDVPPVAEVRAFLKRRLPDYMMPAAFVTLRALPLTPNGKLDRKALPPPEGVRPALEGDYVEPGRKAEKEIARVWQEVLQLDRVGIHDNFFDLGGDSQLIVRVQHRLKETLNWPLQVADLFERPTVHALALLRADDFEDESGAEVGLRRGQMRSARAAARRQQRHALAEDYNVSPQARGQKGMSNSTNPDPHGDSCLAVIGMHCRVPGAESSDEFWRNLCAGVEAVTHFTDEELLGAGADPATLADPGYVKAKAVLDGVEMFDASFFGLTPREAQLMDPQHRLFLECAWEALEACGYLSEQAQSSVGVFTSCGMNTYLLDNLAAGHGMRGPTDYHKLVINNDKDFIATRVSYKLNLKGPSVNVATACSSSLVGIHFACQSLLNGECDLALAGGVSIPLPVKTGYLYQEGGILSEDGHCRAFDARATGTAVGSGVAVVVLKRLADALSDRDRVYAVIRGSAINNDGASKAGYTAPSVRGQAEVIAQALAVAGVEPESITYVETHGTGTPLGDPIEIAALTKAFRAHGARRNGFCAIGSAKTNIGHLDAAAGAVGLIKAALALHHKKIPPSLNFESANPEIDFAESPFYVNTALTDWERAGDTPRRAGVSSFGLGGTNAHVVLEEAGETFDSDPSLRPYQLLLCSTKTATALPRAVERLETRLRGRDDLDVADAAFTSSVGRRQFAHRRALVCPTGGLPDASREDESGVRRTAGVASEQGGRPVAFLFPGGGVEHPGMAAQLYASEPVFRQEMDRCVEIMARHLPSDFKDVLYPRAGGAPASAAGMERLSYGLPALFATEYALARLWMSWGVRPRAFIGHSLGEYTAACLSGVFSLEDCLAVVTTRGRLIEKLPRGAMLGVHMPEEQLLKRLGPGLSVAAVNGPTSCVLSGSADAVAEAEASLTAEGVKCRRLHVSGAAHSGLIDEVLEEFRGFLETISFRPPGIPWASNLTGEWVTDEATDPDYWCRHMRRTVRFKDGVRNLFRDPEQVLLEVGPGQTLTSLVLQQPDRPKDQLALPSMPHPQEPEPESAFLLGTLGALWAAGVEVDWRAFYRHETRRRVPLPTYPFERQRHWAERPAPPRPEQLHVGAQPHADTQTRTETAPMPEPESSRRAMIASQLKEVLSEISGIPGDEIDPSASFPELGLESLVLLELKRFIKTRHGVDLQMRHLLDELSTLDALADHVTPLSNWQTAPAAVQTPHAQTPAAPVPTTPSSSDPHASYAATPAGADGGVERIVAQQLELMRLQLEMLRGGATPSAEAATHTNGNGSRPRVAGATPAATPAPAKQAPRPLHFSSRSEASASGLPLAQRRHLEALVERYARRTRLSKEYARKHRHVLADSRAAVGFRLNFKEMLYPIVAESARGAHFRDIDGNEYVDLTNGFGVTLFGHHPPFLVEALAEHAGREILLGPRSPLVGEVAQLISELTGMARVAFCNSGTEAVMAAIRLARTRTGRSKIVLFEGSYHGHSDQTLAKPEASDDGPRSVPFAPGIPPEAVSNTIVLEYGAPESLDFIREHAAELAAVLIEPVQNMRLDLQPAEFLRELRALTREAGVAYIFDEMITGFRLHPGGAQAYFGVEADIATYGKVIGGGMPIGVVAGSAEYMDGIDGGFWDFGDASYPQAERTFFGGTFCQHPLTMVAALAVLKELKRSGPSLQEGLNRRTAEFAATLNGYFAEEDVPIRVTHFGSAFRFNFGGKLEPFFFHLLEKGVYIWEWRGCFLSTALTDQDLGRVVAAVKETVGELREGGFLPARTPARRVEDGRGAEFALTPAQRQLWSLSQLDEHGGLAYKMGLSLALKGGLDVEDLRRAVGQVVARHESLRTVIAPDGSAQRVRAHAAAEVELIDFSATPAAEREARVDEWFERKNAAPMSMEEGPLFVVHLLRLRDDLHLLVMTAHHIVGDGLSVGLIFKELMSFYTAAREGTAAETRPPLQYREYVAWQEGFGEDEAMNAQRDFWLGQFAGEAPALDLPLDYPRPPRKSYRSRRCSTKIGADLGRRLAALCRAEKCTSSMLLYAAYGVLLHRLTGQEDVLVAISAAGRSLEGGDSLVGYCTHMLPVRNQVEAGASFSEHLSRTRGRLLEAYENADYPFAMLLDELKRAGRRAPVISATFNLDEGGRPPAAHGLEVELHPHPIHFADFDLMLNVTRFGGELTIDCDYNAGIFRRESVEGMLQSYLTLLEDITADPRRRISRLALLTEEESARVLSLGENGSAEPQGTRCIHQLFEEQVERAARRDAGGAPDTEAAGPPNPALVYEDERLTYAELNRRANQLAHHLIARGVRADTLVALCLEPSPEMVVAVLGVLKAGGAYVPLDPAYPRERLALLLEDSGAPVVVTREKFVERLPAREGRSFVLLDADRDAISREPDANPAAEVAPGNLAYVIYTSGSTGTPKGVLVQHDNVARLFSATAPLFDFGERDVWTLFHSYAFDFSVWEIFGALLHGGTLVVVPHWVTRNPDEFYRLLCKEGVTVLNQTPSAFGQLMPAEQSGSRPDALRLRLVIFGGERLDFKSLGPWFDRHPDTRPTLVNMYGITETTVHVTHRVLRAADAGLNASRIGLPIQDLRLYVLDGEMRPVGVGVPGEIYVGGAGLARGYLNRDDITRERFLANPFRPGERLYRTGDMGRWTHDGEVEYLGRRDEQVKVRGYRIEVGEVEAALGAHPDIKQAVVTHKPAGANGDGAKPASQLVAHFVADGGGRSPRASELRSFLAQKLPDYMIPAAFFQLERLPLTPNGKVDKNALPAAPAAPERRDSYAPPRDATERLLVGLWEKLLEHRPIGIHDNFFELGGDSITIMQLAGLAKAAGIHAPLRRLSERPTVAEMAEMAHAPAERVSPAGDAGPAVPLTPIQRWFFAQRSPEPHHYNMALLLEVAAGTEARLLRAAFDALVARHDALRLTFDAHAEGWRQSLSEEARALSVEEIDLSTFSAEEREAGLLETATRLQAGLRLSEAPLMRAALFRLGADAPSRLLVVAHHLIFDGVSWRVLLEDLQTAYAQAAAGRAPELPAKTSSFKDWAARVEQEARSPRFLRELAYWEEVAASAAPLPLDASAPPERNTVESEARLAVSLDEEETARLTRGASKAGHARVNEILLSALGFALSRWVGPESVLVDVEAHGRSDLFDGLDLSRTVGWFTCIYPLRLSLAGCETPLPLLQQVRERLRQVPHGGLGFSLLSQMSPDPDMRARIDALPRAQILFNYLGRFDRVFSGDSMFGMAREPVGLQRSPRGLRTHLLEINAFVADGRLRMDWAYSANFHDGRTVSRLASDFRAALAALTDEPRREPAFDLPDTDLSEEQLRQVLTAVENREAV